MTSTELEKRMSIALFKDGKWAFTNQQGWLVCRTCGGVNRNASKMGGIPGGAHRELTHGEDCVMHDVFRILNVYQEKK